MSGWISSTGWNINLAAPGPIGSTTPSSGAFTNISASGTVSGTGFNNYLASPPAIGGTAAAAGSFTTLNASSNVTLSGGTANGVVYLDGSKVATSGNTLVFDGSNFGLGVTPSAWIGSWKALQVGQSAAITSGGASDARLSCNSYLNGSAQAIYLNTGAATNYAQANGAHFWFNAPSGTAGNFITFTQVMQLDANGNLLVGAPAAPSGSQVSGNAIINGVISTTGYTVATLPTGMPTGSRAYVTDALTPVVLTTVAGGGAVVVPVFYNGSAWIVG